MRQQCPLLALSGHLDTLNQCPLLEAKRALLQLTLMSVIDPKQTSMIQIFRRSATYVHKILQGTKPSDLPVEQPTKFDLVLNLKTAKTLGLTFPQTLLATADEMIE
jgi:hypothetical protein